MGQDRLSRKYSTLLAGLFTIVMVFTTIVLPVKLDSLLSSVIPRQISTWIFWTIGVVSFCLLIALVVVGLVLEKTRLSSLGSFLLYLPTLCHFFTYMWWFYGLGILFVLWLPLAPILNFVGELVYLPYLVLDPLLRGLFWLLGMDMNWSTWMITWYGITCILLGSGSFVFLLGTEAWLYGKRKRKGVIDFGMYKYSRHPQYLGFILWSYGGIARLGWALDMFRFISPGFPWFVSVLLIMCVALFEEQTMAQEYGEEYWTYREETPFLLPLPSWLVKLVTAPMRLLLGKPRPTRKREIAYVFFLYLGLYLPAAFLFHRFTFVLLEIRYMYM